MSWNILLTSPWLWAGVCGVGILSLAAIAVQVFRSRRGQRDQAVNHLYVDVKKLGAHGPPPGPQLEYYGTPVRIAVLVLAPAGRHHQMPDTEELPDVVEQLIPGLLEILGSHQPAYRTWEPQISSSGFSHSFFNHVPLPGEKGRNTPWCSLAGKFDALGMQFLIGIVMVADSPNGFDQRVVEHAGQWHDILRVVRRR